MKPEETKGTARQNDNTLIKVLTFTVDKTMELTKSNSVLGEPVTVGDMTVIPISKLSLGFAGGGATRADVALFKANVAPHVKIKAAGGISSIDDAEKFIALGADRLGTSRIVKIAKGLANDGTY